MNCATCTAASGRRKAAAPRRAIQFHEGEPTVDRLIAAQGSFSPPLGHLSPANIRPVPLRRSTADRFRKYRPVVEHRLAQCLGPGGTCTCYAAATSTTRFGAAV